MTPTASSPAKRLSSPDHMQLPCEDGIPVNNSLEPWQNALLSEAIEPVLRRRHPDGDYFVGMDVGIYWREIEPPLLGARSPDWFYVPDVPRLLDGEMRRSYVMWRELVHPYIVLEFASRDGSEERDRTPWQGKFWIYERVIQPAFYGIYERDLGRVEVYRHTEDHFAPVEPNARGHFALPALGVEFGIWQGSFMGYECPWLRWYDAQGFLLPAADERTDQERRRADQERQRADQERQRADQERQRADQERQRAEKAREKLRSLGINPDDL